MLYALLKCIETIESKFIVDSLLAFLLVNIVFAIISHFKSKTLYSKAQAKY